MPVPNTVDQFGDTDFIFGPIDLAALQSAIGDWFSVETAKYDEEPEIDAEAKGPGGNVVSAAQSKPALWKITMTIDGYLKNNTQFRALSSFSFQGRFYRVKSRSRSDSNEDWVKCTLTAVSMAGITS